MNIVGAWLNELGSTLTISDVSSGIVTGSYTTAVSASGCAQGTYILTGSTDVDSGGSCIAFTVAWNNAQSDCHAVTSWSGQFYQMSDGSLFLLSMWLLSSAQASVEQAWQSTLVGEDFFYQPSSTAPAGQSFSVGDSRAQNASPQRPIKAAHP